MNWLQRLATDDGFELIHKSSQVIPMMFDRAGFGGRQGGKEEPQPKGWNIYLEAHQVHPFVYDCIQTIANTAADIPIDVLEVETNDQTAQRSRNILFSNGPMRASYNYDKLLKKAGLARTQDHDLLELLYMPPPEDESLSLIQGLFQDLEITGNAYWELIYEGRGRSTLSHFWPVRPTWVYIVPGDKELKAGYLVKVNRNEPVAIDKQDMLQFKYRHPSNELYGLGPMSALRMDIETDVGAAKWNRSLQDNLGVPEGLLSFPQAMDDDSVKRFIDEWEDRHKGPENARKLMYLDNGASWTPMSMLPKDMEFLNMRKWTREVISAVYGVPPIYTNDFSSASYSNATVQVEKMYFGTLKPRVRMIERVLNNFIRQRMDESIQIRFNFASVEALAERLKERAEAGKAMMEVGFSHNRMIQALWPEEEALPDSVGSIVYAPFQMVPIGRDDGEVFEQGSPEPLGAGGQDVDGSDEGEGGDREDSETSSQQPTIESTNGAKSE